jgi:phosphoribosylanthranilate isomerase
MAAEQGADAIGLIFHPPATRGVSLLTAEQIIASLPPFADPVGLFLDSPSANIKTVAARLKLQWVQLHGRETPQQVEELEHLHVIKAIHVKPDRLDETLNPWREAVAKGLTNLRALVLETGWASAKGGTGIENDWEQIRTVQMNDGFDDLPPIILAGGLRPSTVGNVIEMLRPWAVDVSSGVEEQRGRKSPERTTAFFRAVRAADHNCNRMPTNS